MKVFSRKIGKNTTVEFHCDLPVGLVGDELQDALCDSIAEGFFAVGGDRITHPETRELWFEVFGDAIASAARKAAKNGGAN